MKKGNTILDQKFSLWFLSASVLVCAIALAMSEAIYNPDISVWLTHFGVEILRACVLVVNVQILATGGRGKYFIILILSLGATGVMGWAIYEAHAGENFSQMLVSQVLNGMILAAELALSFLLDGRSLRYSQLDEQHTQALLEIAGLRNELDSNRKGIEADREQIESDREVIELLYDEIAEHKEKLDSNKKKIESLTSVLKEQDILIEERATELEKFRKQRLAFRHLIEMKRGGVKLTANGVGAIICDNCYYPNFPGSNRVQEMECECCGEVARKQLTPTLSPETV